MFYLTSKKYQWQQGFAVYIWTFQQNLKVPGLPLKLARLFQRVTENENPHRLNVKLSLAVVAMFGDIPKNLTKLKKEIIKGFLVKVCFNWLCFWKKLRKMWKFPTCQMFVHVSHIGLHPVKPNTFHSTKDWLKLTH